MSHLFNRNETVLLNYINGISQSDLARYNNISRQRVFQIIDCYGKSFLHKKEKNQKTFQNEAELMFKNGLQMKDFKKYNIPEKMFFKNKIKEGYKIYRNGWPDFLLFKDEKFYGYEIKWNKERMSIRQEVMKIIFKKLGIHYIVQRF